MARASVKIFKENNLIAETNVETRDTVISETLVDNWTDMFREKGLALKSLNAEDWDTIEFNCDGTVYTRNF
jgi:hypothetical protein